MSKKREYRPPGESGYPVGMINGWPDSRGLPTVKVVCEGRRDKGTEHAETVVATFACFPFDPSKGERGLWHWDQNVAVGGARRHATTRLREDRAKRAATEAERAGGWPWATVEASPKLYVGGMEDGQTLHLKCTRCPCDLRLKKESLQVVLDGVVLGSLDDEAAELLHLAARKVSLPALIAVQTKPKRR